MITFTCLATITTIFATPAYDDGHLPAHFDVTAQPVVAQAEDNDARHEACNLIRNAQIKAIKEMYEPEDIQWIGSTIAYKNGVTGVSRY